MEGYRQEDGGKGTGNKKHKWQAQKRQGEVENSIGNGEAKELICITHGHQLKWGNDGGRWGIGQRRMKGRKKWYNLNAIINKIYLKNKNKLVKYFKKQFTLHSSSTHIFAIVPLTD